MSEYGSLKPGYADLEGNPRLPFYAVRNPDVRAYLAEFVGTFILVLIGDGSVAQYVLGGGDAGHYLSVNLAWGIALLFGIHFSGGVSGGHLNPAVTLTLAVFGRFEWYKLPGYFIAQTLGAFAAAWVVFVVYYPWFDLQDPQRETTQGIFATYPNEQIPNWCGLANEIVGTALLVSGIFAVGDQLNKPASPYSFPGAVALMLTCIGMAFGLDTGYALNPARDFGPRLFTFFAGWGWKVFTARSAYFWIPIVGPFVGGLLGAGMYVGLIENYHPHLQLSHEGGSQGTAMSSNEIEGAVAAQNLTVVEDLERCHDELFTEFPEPEVKKVSRLEREKKELANRSLVYGEIPFTTVDAIFQLVMAAALLHDFSKCCGIEVLDGLHALALKVLDRWRYQMLDSLPATKADVDVGFAKDQLAVGTYFVTVTKPLESTRWQAMHEEKFLMSWGRATVIVQKKMF
ncbi:hypothetical protein BBO99_00004565 [Phytophthora kernoviae]|uniref:Aquaporin n=2 Tax=Phytophthora kernoviae TaxID=325452 RepID=A0A421GQY7_9STRA|nr:hypothetical protein G195_004970 [Phytophthora kernoviae 00238/432]KAG2525701.1 hypothetical protein JM16_004339 [Phytophthora kernoviae]KAG2527435.1 hypothetical protein JM18_003854 [Phytophthora kernoviae]RLN38247.1 hypothetical protein BBI17_004752 [Phytophthora kernoviae]RLN80346.1 hypothetical protein BBO99_00004565 [Phytophthora kernoviae]